jgi:serine/tyrosine/threonine adenylyltransferase
MERLSSCVIRNRFVDSLPGDKGPATVSRQVFEACYSLVAPTAVAQPELLSWSDSLADIFPIRCPQTDDDIAIFAGNRICAEMKPYAACYGGHQFGNWAGQLGDGRAITLCEILDKTGQAWEMQLKGAGPTPYSRRSDGRAVLRSSIREYLVSEAMHGLGVPTTRALSLVKTGDPVVRDMLYNGNPREEPGAIVTRMSPSFLRFGNFEICAARDDRERLRMLVDWTISSFFTEYLPLGQQAYQRFYEEVCRRTADLIVHWYRVGFVHGVMNTDNMSILGLTIDYGPFGFLDSYDPFWTPNTTDLPGRRYCFARQASVALWNLSCLGNALVPLISDVEKIEAILEQTRHAITSGYAQMMRTKLGLSEVYQEEDSELLTQLMKFFDTVETDMTIFFRVLSDLDETQDSVESWSRLLSEAFYQQPSPSEQEVLHSWLTRYRKRLSKESRDIATRQRIMQNVNPAYILRNYMAQEAIDAAEAGDYSLIEEILMLLSNPYQRRENAERWFKKRPDWARTKVGCSVLSCSS